MASGDDPPVITRSLFGRSGSFRTYEMHRSLMRDADGNPSGMRVIFVDVTDSKSALEEARRTAQWLRSALQSVADAVILTDALGIVRSVNPAAEEFSGWRACDLIGLAIETVLPRQAFSCEGDAVLNLRALLEHPCSGLAAILTRDGREVRVAINASPILDNTSGSVSGVAVLLRRIEPTS
jgi:PAS domain S-box-containing protein